MAGFWGSLVKILSSINMNFKELQKIITNNVKGHAQKNNFAIDENFALLKIYDDIGELSQAILINKQGATMEGAISQDESRKELGKKLADLLSMLLVIAEIYQVDVEKEIGHKLGKNLE